MIIELLDDCINDMKEVHRLEELYKQKEYHERLEKNLIRIINENDLLMNKVKLINAKVGFCLSSENVELALKVLDKIEVHIRDNNITEDLIRDLSYKNKVLLENIPRDWERFYTEKTEKVISMLETIRDIAVDRKKIDYTIGKIQKAKSWMNLEENIELYVRGMKDANDLITELDLDDIEIAFLKKVTSGTATINDLSENILEWIRRSDIGGKLLIKFA